MRISVNHLFLLLIIALVFTSCKQKNNNKSATQDVETKILFEEKKEVDSKLFGLKSWVTDEVKFNDHPTIKLNSKHKYGLDVKLENLVPDAFVRITVWRNSKTHAGKIAITSKDIKFYQYGFDIVEYRKDGWHKMILEAFISPLYNGEEAKVYVMNPDKEEAYFSDLKVTVYNKKPYPIYEEKNTIELLIDEETISYINKKRKVSFRNGVITKKTKKEFDAKIVINKTEYPATLRIKGDWLDHIQGNKWSFRIKMKAGNFHGMKEFSIQEPGTREYLSEWVLHKLFESEDVLTTRYGFVPVKLNGASLGIYAYEEHFEKRLVESRNRREGPILKFDEDPMWIISRGNVGKKEGFLTWGPVMESATIKPFKKKTTMKNENLRQQYLIGQNLLNQYRYDDEPISDLFKIEPFAKFYALTNVARVWHPLRWHNERFYYDPVASKLEVIAYDCNTRLNVDEKKPWLTPDLIFEGTSVFFYDSYLAYSPFNDASFLQQYLTVMEQYLNTDKLLTVFDQNLEQIKIYEEWIKREYTHYNYNYDFLSNSIKKLKPQYQALKDKLRKNELKAILKSSSYNYGKNEPLEGFMLQGFTESFGKIRVRNFHTKQMYLIGYSSKERPEQGVTLFEEAIRFEAYKGLSEIDKKDVSCLYTPDKIYFKDNLQDTTIYDIKVMPWPEPGHDSPRQNLLKNAITKSSELVKVSGNIIVFNPGKHIITEPVVISSGMKVVINEETHLDFIEGAFFLSFSPVEIKGKANNKVIIESSDGTARGFTVIGAGERSNIEHTTFDGWNTLDYNGWTLTGAITFYESDVTINNTDFLNNNCEDALNVIRADFTLKHSLIANAFADGFDADFTTGLVSDCDFKRIGNDGIDYSGSEITIENVRIDHAGDKGISGGEASTLYLKNIVISNSNIGIASKDQSKLFIENIQLINCNCGFAAYQKKMEFGPAELVVTKCEFKDVKEVYLLDKESVIVLEGNKNKGDVKLNVDSLYAQ